MKDTKRDQWLDPVEIARVALRNLTARGLPPTPENYASEYCKVAGISPVLPPIPEAALSPESQKLVESLLAQVSETSADLATGVDQFQVDTGPLLAGLDMAPTAEAIPRLLQAFTRSTLTLRQTVEASRAELAEIRRQLDQANGELTRATELAHTDFLTGISNRRAMSEVIVRDIARAQRDTDSYAVAILDIDHFKAVNDQYGHAAGDKALVHIAVVARSGMRETDAIYRYGGEEFVILLPGASAQGAHFVVDRLRKMVEKTPCLVDNLKINLRFSAGVAELHAGENAPELLGRADQALLEAKRNGRNRVSVAMHPLAAVQSIKRSISSGG